MDVTVMAKACASKGRAEVTDTTMKVVKTLRKEVEVRTLCRILLHLKPLAAMASALQMSALRTGLFTLKV
jgi:hypothetical protein